MQISRAWQKQIRCLESKGKYAESSTTSGHWTFTYHKALCSLSPLSPLLSRVAKGNFRETGGGGGEVEGRWSHLVHLSENLKSRGRRDYKSHWIRNREQSRVTWLVETKLLTNFAILYQSSNLVSHPKSEQKFSCLAERAKTIRRACLGFALSRRNGISRLLYFCELQRGSERTEERDMSFPSWFSKNPHKCLLHCLIRLNSTEFAKLALLPAILLLLGQTF